MLVILVVVVVAVIHQEVVVKYVEVIDVKEFCKSQNVKHIEELIEDKEDLESILFDKLSNNWFYYEYEWSGIKLKRYSIVVKNDDMTRTYLYNQQYTVVSVSIQENYDYDNKQYTGLYDVRGIVESIDDADYDVIIRDVELSDATEISRDLMNYIEFCNRSNFNGKQFRDYIVDIHKGEILD